MPPRKKASADAAPALPTRSSARVKAAASASSSTNSTPAPAAPAPKAKASKAKPKAKRTTDESDIEEEDEEPAAKPAPKPAAKRTTKAKVATKKKDEDMDVDEEEEVVKPATKAKAKAKPAAKRARPDSDEEEDPPAKPVSKKAKKGGSTKKDEDDAKPASKAVSPPPKMVTIVKRGAAPVDPVSGKVDSHQVYAVGEVWDAMLNQTEIGANKNKFYVLQLLHPIGNDSQCLLYTRWGRVGENGQKQIKGPWASSTAIAEFKKQFKVKAGVDWEQRVGMVPKKGKYVWLERSFDDEDEQEAETSKSNGKKETGAPPPIPDSELAPEVQAFCKLVFSTSIIDATLSSMNYDAKKLPLGKLSKSTILSGFGALKNLSEVISDPNSDTAKSYGGFQRACEDLSSAYYSVIPHDFGRNRPICINSQELLKRELELVDALGDMEIASKLIQQTNSHTDKDGNPVNPLDAQFRSLGLNSMEPLDRNGKEFKTLEAYAHDTHGATHRHLQVHIENIYKVERPGESEAWKKGGFDKLPDGDRLLLWHGSRTTNFAGILKQGLRIAPPEAPVNGYMFGKGVYFADMMSKSAGYCYPQLSNQTGVLLLCEVAAKPFYELTDAQYDANIHCPKNKKLATKGLGKTQPTKWKDAGKALGNNDLAGCHMPDGGGSDVKVSGGYLQYNEYIVYDISQIRVKYLLMVKM